jgi:hypothetical protein
MSTLHTITEGYTKPQTAEGVYIATVAGNVEVAAIPACDLTNDLIARLEAEHGGCYGEWQGGTLDGECAF